MFLCFSNFQLLLPGVYRLCWCAATFSCGIQEDFRVDAGGFLIIGPSPLMQSRTCVSGYTCLVGSFPERQRSDCRSRHMRSVHCCSWLSQCRASRFWHASEGICIGWAVPFVLVRFAHRVFTTRKLPDRFWIASFARTLAARSAPNMCLGPHMSSL